MAEPRVIFDGVWKKFRRGERHDSLRDLVPATARKLLGRTRDDELEDQEFWALKDVSFEVKPGEALGIIGPNGAGKSTALKLLTRVLRPTKGHCELRGRVGALIEVAAGFHPDLTGRENIFLQGGIMGMSRQEVARRLDAIVEFAGVQPFLDTQVKRYSSGMNARLGFAIAAHLDPQVLVIDEVLSVGDMVFQERCIARMIKFRDAGAAMVFVSHNLQAVAHLCARTLVLARGATVFDGPTSLAFDEYLRASQFVSGKYGMRSPAFVLEDARFESEGPPDAVPPHALCRLVARVRCVRDARKFNFGLEVERSKDLLYCYGVTTDELGLPSMFAHVGDEFEVAIEFRAHLTRGHYRLNLNARDVANANHIFSAESVASFAVQERVSYDGVADVGASFSLRRV